MCNFQNMILNETFLCAKTNVVQTTMQAEIEFIYYNCSFKDVIFNLIFCHFYEKAKTASIRTCCMFSKLNFQKISPFHRLRRPYLSLTLVYCFPWKYRLASQCSVCFCKKKSVFYVPGAHRILVYVIVSRWRSWVFVTFISAVKKLSMQWVNRHAH